MLGRRSTQRGLFDAGNLVGAEQIGQIPFYGKLAANWTQIFKDESFADCYSAGLGRPSKAPSVLATATVLQAYEGISDQEVVDRTKYDLRWKAVFDMDPCSLEALFAKSTLQLFRARLVLNEKQGLVFQASLDEAERAGLLPKKLKTALDSTPVLGRGAVKDTYNLLSDGINKVLRAIGSAGDRKAVEVAKELGLERHLQRGSVKGTRLVDWDDDESVREFLAELVADCRTVVTAATDAGATGADLALLAKIVEENVEEGCEGPQIPQKVPRGRTASVHDHEIRHGRKSSGKLYTGHKVHVCVDAESGFITAIECDEPAVAEGEHVKSLLEQTKARTGSEIAEALGDCAYGTTTAQAQAAEVGAPLISKMPAPPKNRFGPGDFTVSEDRREATCPAGHRSEKVNRSKEAFVHFWAEEVCGACPAAERCIRGKAKRRTLHVRPDFHDRRRREVYARSPEGRAKLRTRTIVEHVIGYMKNLGAGQARYMGRAKTLFQSFMCGAVQNLRRMFNLSAAAASLSLACLLPILALSPAPAYAGTVASQIVDAAAFDDRLGANCPVGSVSSNTTGANLVQFYPEPRRELWASADAPFSRLRRRWLLSPARRPRGPPRPLPARPCSVCHVLPSQGQGHSGCVHQRQPRTESTDKQAVEHRPQAPATQRPVLINLVRGATTKSTPRPENPSFQRPKTEPPPVARGERSHVEAVETEPISGHPIYSP